MIKAKRHRARRAIEELILSGSLLPGELVDTNELVERLNLGKTPVREALLQLEMTGLLQFRDKKGVLVTPITDASLSQHLSTLDGLEGHLIDTAPFPLTAIQIKPLRQTLARIVKSVELDHREDFCRAFELFCRETLTVSDNPHLKLLIIRERDRLTRALFSLCRLTSRKQQLELCQILLNFVDALDADDPHQVTARHGDYLDTRTRIFTEVCRNNGLKRL